MTYELLNIELNSGEAYIDIAVHSDEGIEYSANVELMVFYDEKDDNIIIKDWYIESIKFNEKSYRKSIIGKYVYNSINDCDLEEMIYNQIERDNFFYQSPFSLFDELSNCLKPKLDEK